MDYSINLNNPFLWIALLSALSALALYLINKRTFNLLYGKPIIKIIEISVKPTQDDKWGDRAFDCHIRFHVFNPSSFGNHISGTLKRFYFSSSLITKMYQLGIQNQWGDYCELPPFKKITVDMYPKYEEVEKYKNKFLFLTIEDIRGKRIRKWFQFKD